MTTGKPLLFSSAAFYGHDFFRGNNFAKAPGEEQTLRTTQVLGVPTAAWPAGRTRPLKRDRATGLINFVKLGRGTSGSLVVGIR